MSEKEGVNMEGTTLSELIHAAATIERAIVEAGGELSEETETALLNIDLTLPAKVDGYRYVMEQLKERGDYWKRKAEELSRYSRACARAESRIKDHIKGVMESESLDEIRGNDYRFKLAKCKKSLIVDDNILPGDYKIVVTTVKPDNERIRSALDKGENVPGAHYEGGKSLRTYPNTKK